MKRLTFLFVLCACVFAWSVTGNVFAQPVTQTVVVDFEEFAGTTTLWFYLDGSDYNAYGLATPCYFAFDDLTYELDVEPEPELP
ncbi:MAG: DUF4465 domain-containing protein [Planctomycetaceae bacterium]|jgi:hypothetical protein|nr:DUF4465 domain-containing protein [Planctomycetaceae bacterium]